MKERNMIKQSKTKVKAFVASVNEEVRTKALELAQNLRQNGVPVDFDLKNRQLSRQLEYADSLGIPLVVIVGGKELEKGVVKVRDMKKRGESEVKINNLANFLKAL
jgi:histidyl-tRNA synthetase